MCSSTIQSPWLKRGQARQYLQMSDTTLGKMLASGAIRSVRRGNTVFIKTEWLDAYMESLPSGAKVPEALRSA